LKVSDGFAGTTDNQMQLTLAPGATLAASPDASAMRILSAAFLHRHQGFV